MKKRRLRTDTADAALEAVNERLPAPPDHVHLRPCDGPFWESIVRARDYSSWMSTDLEQAANLARCKADIERLSAELEEEGDVVFNQRGTQIVNPKHQLLEVLSRRSVALSRMLHVHAEATLGRSRDTGQRTKEKAAIRDAAEKAAGDSDGLIAPPVH